MLFRPTVAPARPCRVPREVREFMALALELAVVPAAGKPKGRRESERKRRTGDKEVHVLYPTFSSSQQTQIDGFKVLRVALGGLMTSDSD